ncbi:MAG: cobalamin biosynthesis protein [Thermoguttaceae bacterium]|nr:cobalamin biosynthesis protein [Thermoguttaceae bacterium]
MIIRVCAFTDKAVRLAERIAEAFPDDFVELWRKDVALSEWLEDAFAIHAPIVFVSAVGIAVRLLAPCVRRKESDVAAVVVDELGRFAIPILSGHLGGANRLAETLARRIGATPVITTATDLNGLMAIDVFAAENAMRLSDPRMIVKVSAKLLREGSFELAIAPGIAYEPGAAPPEVRFCEFSPDRRVDVAVSERPASQATLTLIPKRLVLGIGCKKGTPPQVLERFVDERLDMAGLSSVDREFAAIATVDLKRREYALARFATKNRAQFVVYSPEELAAVAGSFTRSEFVRETVGVDNVCERAAVLCAGDGAELVLRKQSGNGVALAIAKRKAVVKTWKTQSIS